jgi:hypothetical protein
MDTGDPQDLRTAAMHSLRQKEEFRRHVLIYVLVNLMLVAIWAITWLTSGQWFPWPLFPILGWGVGLAIHGWNTYARRPPTEDDVQREIQRLQDRQRSR